MYRFTLSFYFALNYFIYMTSCINTKKSLETGERLDKLIKTWDCP